MSNDHSCCAGRGNPDETATAVDPVCGMTVDPAATPHRADHGGETFHFCSAGCRGKFVADPARYLSDRRDPEPATAGTIYTCPMHPEVRQVGPGFCPKCGMALEPADTTVDVGPNPEIIDFTRRFWIGAVLTLPLIAMEMGPHLWGQRFALSPGWNGWLQFAFATPVVLWAGWPFLERGWASVRTWNLNMFTLIGLGTIVAWAFSALAVLAPDLVPAAFRNEPF